MVRRQVPISTDTPTTVTELFRVLLSPSIDTSLSYIKELKSHWQRHLQTDKHVQTLCTHFAPYTGRFIIQGVSLYRAFHYTGRFIMFSVITKVYDRKTKGPTLMELFIATGKLGTFFFITRDVRCVHRW